MGKGQRNRNPAGAPLPTPRRRLPLQFLDESMKSEKASKCSATKKNGDKCGRYAIAGGTCCPTHGGSIRRVKVAAAVRAEVMAWGLGNADVDPAEILLRLVSQSAARAELYSRLLQEAYDAAERLKAAHEAEQLVTAADDGEDGTAAKQQAREDLRRIFNTGGVAALIGKVYSDARDGGIFATGEQIRGLADLEAKERDRCANFAAKAVAAGLAERQVKLAERQGAMILQVLTGVFSEIGLTEAQLDLAPGVIRRHIDRLQIAG